MGGCVSAVKGGTDDMGSMGGMAMPSAEDVQNKALKKAFDSVDEEQKNKITIESLLAYLEKKSVPGIKVEDLKAFLDKQKIKLELEINFNEFRVLFLQVSQQEIKPEDKKYMIEKVMKKFLVKQQKSLLRTVFNDIDTKKTGYITMIDLCDFIEKKGVPGLDVEKVKDIFKKFGVGELIQFSFENFWVLTKQITQQKITKKEEPYTIVNVLKDAAKNAQKVALRTAFNQVDKDNSGVVTAVELIEYLNKNAVPGLDTSKLQDMMKKNGLGDAAEIPFEYFYVIFKEVTGQSLEKKEEKYTAAKLAALNKRNAENAGVNLALRKAFDAMNPVDGKVDLTVILEKFDSFNVPGVDSGKLKKWLGDNKVNTKNLKMSFDTFRVTVFQVL